MNSHFEILDCSPKLFSCNLTALETAYLLFVHAVRNSVQRSSLDANPLQKLNGRGIFCALIPTDGDVTSRVIPVP